MRKLSWVGDTLSLAAILGGIFLLIILSNAVIETVRRDRPQAAAYRMADDPIFRSYMVRDIKNNVWKIAAGAGIVGISTATGIVVIRRAVRRRGAK